MEEFAEHPLTEEISFTEHFEGVEGIDKMVINSLNLLICKEPIAWQRKY